MAVIVLPNRAAGTRPQFCGVNWDSPLTRGLRLWYPLQDPGTAPRDAISGGRPLTTSYYPNHKPISLGGYGREFNPYGGLSQTVGPFSRPPLSIGCWFNAANITQVHTLIGVPYSSFTNYYIAADGAAAGDYVIGIAAVGGDYTAVSTSTQSFEANRWHHTLFVVESGTKRTVYLDGRAGSVSTESRDTAWDSQIFELGVYYAAYSWMLGSLADAVVYNRALTAAEAWALYAPESRWSLYWVPSRRAYLDLVGVTAFTRAPGAGSVTLTGAAPTRLVEHYRTNAAGSLSLPGQAPVARQDMFRAAGAGSLTTTGVAPQARQDMWRVPGAGSVTLTGTTPDQVWYWYQPYQYTRTLGDLDGGTFEDVWTTNGQELVIGEVTGSPGFDVEFDWRSLPAGATGLEIHGRYEGNVAHVVQVQRWNGSSWDVLGTIPSATSNQDYWFVLPESATQKIRFYHTSPGNPVHTLHIDQLAIWKNRYQSDAGSLTLTGYAPAVVQEHYRLPGVGGIVLTGAAPSLSTGYVLTTGSGAITLTGTAAAPRLELYARPSAGTLTWTGLAPTSDVMVPGVYSPDAGILTLTGYNPTVRLDLTIRPDAGTITIDGLQPVAISGALQSIPAGTLTLAGLAPTVQTAAGAIIPGTGQLVLSGYSPSLLRDWLAKPGAGSLSLTGLLPTVLEMVTSPFTMHVQIEGRDFWDPEVRDRAMWSPSVIDPEMEEL